MDKLCLLLRVCLLLAAALGAWHGVSAQQGAATRSAPVKASGFQAKIEWLTGPALEKKLGLVEGISWEDNPLRLGLINLSRAQRVAVLIDRRVDPGRRVTVSVSAPLRAVLEEIVQTHNQQHCGADAFPRPAVAIGVTRIGPVFYVGPADTASKLRTVVEVRKEETRKLPPAARQAALRVHAWKWDDATSPKELLDKLAAETKIEIGGAEQAPHDLWAAGDLPALSFTERLSLVAACYDLTFRWDESGEHVNGEHVNLVKIRPEDLLLTRTYPAGSNPKQFADQVRKVLPEAKVELAGNTVSVTGTAEDHQALADARDRGRDPPTTSGKVKELYSLNAPNAPLRSVLNSLKEQKKLVFKVDEQALAELGLSLDTRVSVNVKQVELDVLLMQALSQAKLTFRHVDGTIEILPMQ